MWNSGMTSGQIGKALKISRSAVMGLVSRMRARGLDLREGNNVVYKDNDNDNKLTSTRRGGPPVRPRVKRSTRPPSSARVAFSVEDLFNFRPEKGKTVMTVGLTDCRYVISRGVFCGEPGKSASRPWCDHHYSMIYVPVKKSTKKRLFLTFGISRKYS
jgi:hypothetical protein